jgi:hypothetical protein
MLPPRLHLTQHCTPLQRHTLLRQTQRADEMRDSPAPRASSWKRGEETSRRRSSALWLRAALRVCRGEKGLARGIATDSQFQLGKMGHCCSAAGGQKGHLTTDSQYCRAQLAKSSGLISGISPYFFILSDGRPSPGDPTRCLLPPLPMPLFSSTDGTRQRVLGRSA